ncbi:MAG: hypothetical protein ACRD2C_02170 [Acidimicrobiales bacterium]
MAQELAATASAGGVMLLLTMVLAFMALEGAAGDRSHQPTLVAGLLVHRGLVAIASGRAERDRRRAAVRTRRAGRALPLGHLRHTR